MVEGATYEAQVGVLQELCEKTGDCAMNGYLGSSVTNISYDQLGNLEFQSKHRIGNLLTDSTGVLLYGSLLVKQTQVDGNKRDLQLFSWKRDGSGYTYIAFDNEDVLNVAYEKIRTYHPDFLNTDVNLDLEQLQISMDNVMDIKVLNY